MTESAKPSKAQPINVGAQQVAAIYARAFLGAAHGAGEAGGKDGNGEALDSLVKEFDDFITLALDAKPEFERFLSDVRISADDKTALLERVLANRTSPKFLNFLKVLARRERLDLLRRINEQTRVLYDELRGRARVGVTTATPLSPELKQQLFTTLKTMLRAEPVLETHEDPEILGGIVLRVGDTVFDGSVARQLAQLREQMIDRSVHEIQSRRDRFRNSG